MLVEPHLLTKAWLMVRVMVWVTASGHTPYDIQSGV